MLEASVDSASDLLGVRNEGSVGNTGIGCPGWEAWSRRPSGRPRLVRRGACGARETRLPVICQRREEFVDELTFTGSP
jgi:hypothetical protein